tara:strand:+ start:446 stop:598 length:153 start_codon:yes stop_codon:yes gene_type:complete
MGSFFIAETPRKNGGGVGQGTGAEILYEMIDRWLRNGKTLVERPLRSQNA